MSSKNIITLGYWPVRGISGSINNLLRFCELPYAMKIYKSRADWFDKDKFNLGLKYPNLPYLIDGDQNYTESIAILNYIPIKAYKKELLGTSDNDFLQILIGLGLSVDIRDGLDKICFTTGDFEAERKEVFTKGSIIEKLEMLNHDFATKEWFTGSLTIADFQLFEAIELAFDMNPTKFSELSNLIKFLKRFENIPQIAEYRASEDFPKAWFGSKKAKWTKRQ